jgi:molybdopterin-guanine dinucleotide biosynthesis protein A
MNFSAVILAGGKSSRMGRDKAWLEIGGQTLLARQTGLVRELGAAETFVSGRADADYSAFGCRVLLDQFADAGPLAGIERALGEAAFPMLLVLAVDLPEMSVNFLRRLVAGGVQKQGAIPRVNGKIEPLAAVFPKSAHTLAVAQIARGQFAAKDFAGLCVQTGLARFIELETDEAHCLANWNWPADLPRPNPSEIRYGGAF